MIGLQSFVDRAAWMAPLRLAGLHWEQQASPSAAHSVKICDCSRAGPDAQSPERRAEIRHLADKAASPEIDGKLDDPAWKQATVLEDYRPMMYFVRDRLAVQTTCRVTWDDRFLYLAFDCREPRMAELPPTSNQRKRNRNTLVLSKSPGQKFHSRRHPAGRLSEHPGTEVGNPGMGQRHHGGNSTGSSPPDDRKGMDRRMASPLGTSGRCPEDG